MGIARMGGGGSTPARLFWSLFSPSNRARKGYILTKKTKYLSVFGKFHHHYHQNYYLFHHRNHHFNYQNQFELDSVIRTNLCQKKNKVGILLSSFGGTRRLVWRPHKTIFKFIDP